MSAFGSKRARGKQTYGKPVKSHVAGWFGRNLWEDPPSTTSSTFSFSSSTTSLVTESTVTATAPETPVRAKSAFQVLTERKAQAERTNAASTEVADIADGLALLKMEEPPVEAEAVPEATLNEMVVMPDSGRISPAKPVLGRGTEAKESPDTVRIQSSRSTRQPLMPSPANSTRSRRSTKEEPEALIESPVRRNSIRKRASLSPQQQQKRMASPLRKGRVSARIVSEEKENLEPDLSIDEVVEKSATRRSTIEVVIGKGDAEKPGTPQFVQEKPEEELKVQPDRPDNTSTDTFTTALDSPRERPMDSMSEVEQLLQLCTTSEIADFTAQIASLEQDSTLTKLGEASYSEVFLQTPENSSSTTVLKIIPFGKEDQCEVKSIVQEVRISKAMAEIEGFIGFHGAYVVRGQFPERLMELWDIYDEERGSESERPDYYEDDQLFAVIMLENGGRDLEHFDLHSWTEAHNIFWQVVSALARGEAAREFEHRDLHFGNIVIRRISADGPDTCSSSSGESSSEEDAAVTLLANLSLTHRPHLKVALIDYTLSRAYCGDLVGAGAFEFAPLDDEALFTGKGDYQFDMYRFMRRHLASGLVDPAEEDIDWNRFAPRTNVFWLHYLTNILLNKKGISKPAARGRGAASEGERACWQGLEAIAKAIDPRKKRFGKGRCFESAREVLEWAVEERLVEGQAET